MNRIATTHQWWEILIIVLAIVVLAILSWSYWGDKGLFSGIKSAAETTWGYLPNITIGLNSLNATRVTLPGKQEAAVSGLQATLTRMMGAQLTGPTKNGCFDNFGGFKEDLGDNDKKTTKISLYYDQRRGGTAVLITTAGGQTYEGFFVEKMHPCVIAGIQNEAENFFNYFNKEGELKEYYYSPVLEVDILYYNKLAGYSGNVIRVMGWPENIVNNQGDNFQNGGYLFKAPGNNICFFPTNKISNSDQHGIDNNYIADESDSESIAYRLKHNDERVKPCT
ncbi:MAG: hypothetical protein V2A62_05625 [Candidatus Woesearchaeota archaeon]